jgi:hypothetical protein
LEEKVAEEKGEDVLCTSIAFVSPLPLLLAFFFVAIAAAASKARIDLCRSRTKCGGNLFNLIFRCVVLDMFLV